MTDPQNERLRHEAAALAQDLRALVSKLRRRLRVQAHVGELTPSQASVLRQLDAHGPATTSHLARSQGIRPQSMAPIVTALTDAGFISSQLDPSDGRQTLLSLTDTCRRQILEGRAARQDWLTRAFLSRFSAQEQAELTRAVALLKRLVDE
ncbi:MarR family winged helix-turn-helix transcriptional regulator [Acetobacter orleanensis]|uniref:MarR family transcriptional regulator n=1 Tax=Acetobacter orleanensis TaxID=104099 RepID=A0A4Y3TK35_9PROT|nr:MarR family transcriptional regulator [Acetobacter orleanensis]KXV67031.1 MarR family transcriptional regulator [Acetobacter orleanensis]PCD78714.1 MarR family transcriptional regulator [Acetobacter orleanensis]GAN67364.1 transcriptional regulator MarR [Acetobacter orleanensis JCM 7639]GBR23632.1 MarR family transcriptional regulator [Acetobacter orleanensis NRIC 0473]GEB83351.1 MarR family transcriptional regulator [Acetobacter orleanensis]